MPDERSLLDRMMDFVDYHLGGTVTDRPPQKRGDSHSSAVVTGGSGASGGFDDCSGASDGGGDCGGVGDGGGGD
jgi:hypothetical protein